jgi:hypothetical protein
VTQLRFTAANVYNRYPRPGETARQRGPQNLLSPWRSRNAIRKMAKEKTKEEFKEELKEENEKKNQSAL